jgi:hypothetical protein
MSGSEKETLGMLGALFRAEVLSQSDWAEYRDVANLSAICPRTWSCECAKSGREHGRFQIEIAIRECVTKLNPALLSRSGHEQCTLPHLTSLNLSEQVAAHDLLNLKRE